MPLINKLLITPVIKTTTVFLPRDTYLDYHWIVTSNYLSCSLSKLFICPPLAIKRQNKTPLQARGFQEVAIDAMGRIEREIFWFNPSDRTFDTERSSQNNQL